MQAATKTLPTDIEIKPVKYEGQKVNNSRGPAKRTKGDHQEKQTKDEGKFVELEGMRNLDKNHKCALKSDLKKVQFWGRGEFAQRQKMYL